MASGDDIITHPDAQLHIFSSVHLHPLIQQTDLLKVQPIHHEAAYQGRAPGGFKMMKISFVSLMQVILSWHSFYSNRGKKRNVSLFNI